MIIHNWSYTSNYGNFCALSVYNVHVQVFNVQNDLQGFRSFYFLVLKLPEVSRKPTIKGTTLCFNPPIYIYRNF